MSTKTGWWNPDPFRSTSKFHYVDKSGRSLCRKWGYIGRGLVEEGMDDHADNCAACKKAKLKLDANSTTP